MSKLEQSVENSPSPKTTIAKLLLLAWAGFMAGMLAAALSGCGDNIVVPAPDAGTWQPDDVPGDLDVAPEHDHDHPVPDAPAPDAVTPDAPLPICDDKHIEINGHEHKCQHAQVLPAK